MKRFFLPLFAALVAFSGPALGDCVLRQSDTVELALGPFVDSTDGFTAETALTISQADVRLKKCAASGDCGAWAQVNEATSASHEENGWYEKDFNTTDTDTIGILYVAVNETGALPVWKECLVIETAVYDADYADAATGLRQANVASITDGAVVAADFGAGAIDANAIATDAIGAAELATDAVGATEIAANAIGAAELADASIDDATFATTAGAFSSLRVIDQGTAQAATATTLQLRAAATFADSEPVGSTIVISSATAGAGQSRTITAYVSSTDTATVANWTTTPTGTIVYKVYAEPPGSGGSVTIGAGGISASSFAAGAIDAAAIATDAIGSAEIATDAIGAAELAADAIGSSELATDAVGAAEVAANAIGAAEFADGVIDEAAFSSTAGPFQSLGINDQGTAQAATATTLQLRSAASFADDEIIGATCMVVTATTGAGQSRTVTDYVSSTDTATVDTWTTTPTGTIVYKCFGTAPGSGTALTAADVWSYGSGRSITAVGTGGITTTSFATGAIDSAAIATDAVGANELAADAIGASEIAADAIGANELAADSITSSELATDSIGSAELAAGAIGSSEIADGGITSTEFGTAAITAAVLAADAVGAAELAADAVVEIQSGLATASALTTVDDFLDTEIADIQARLPASLVSGRIDASVGAVASAAITATAIAADAIGASEMAADANTEIATAVRDVVVEDQGSISLGCALAAALAGMAGDLDITGSSGIFEEATGAETRITYTITAGDRTSTITCPTY